MDGELGGIGCKRLLLEGISKEILLCSTENEVDSLMMEHDNGTKTKYTCMGNWVTMLDSGKNCLGERTIKKHPRGQDGGGVGGEARPLPQTQQKKHIYRRNNSHRTTTNRWQRNLNSNNGKKFVTLLDRWGRKGRVSEDEPERDGLS